MTDYNHAFSISASIVTNKDPDQIKWPEYREALLKRIHQLDREQYPEESCDVWDTYIN